MSSSYTILKMVRFPPSCIYKVVAAKEGGGRVEFTKLTFVETYCSASCVSLVAQTESEKSTFVTSTQVNRISQYSWGAYR